MSIEMMNRAWKQRGLTPAQKLVLLKLADHANDEGLAYPGQRRMGDECEMSERSVRNQLSALEAKGLVRIVNRGNRPNHYWLYPAKMTAQDSAPHPATDVRGIRQPVADEPSENHQESTPSSSDKEPSSSEVGASAPSNIAQRAVTEYVDACVEKGVAPKERTKAKLGGIVAHEIGLLREQGREPPWEAVQFAVSRIASGRAVEQFDELVREAMLKRADLRPDGKETVDEEAKRRVSEAIAQNGWPTGARFVRGTHSGSYVPDVWGTERPEEHDWPHSRPAYADLLADMTETVRREREAT